MKKWYLMNETTRPNVTGGYENDAFLEEKEDAFIETLNTAIGKTVKLYNSDLTEIGYIRIIIQDNLANTQLKSLERSILAPIGTLKAGMYIYYENRYWLISGYPGNNGICEKATAILCQYKIRWQKEDGSIIERWANFTSASKYDVGENGNYYITLSSNNFTIWIPEDDDGETLDGKRIFVDRNINNPRKVFKITRSDDVLYLFGEDHGGILSFIADKTELDMNVDRPDLLLCDYKSTVPDNSDIQTKISGGKSLRYNKEKAWTVSFKDIDGNEVDDFNFEWNVIYEQNLSIVKNKKDITIKTDDEDSIGSSFLLQIISNDIVMSELRVFITSGF